MKVNLLIVDDEAEICSMLARHFAYLNFEVTTAANGKEAIKILATKKIDIIISDIMMPEMSGVELLKHVRSEYPMIRTIMITGYVTLNNALACIRYGAEGCVFKPLSELSLLEDAVNQAVAKIRYWADILKELQGLK